MPDSTTAASQHIMARAGLVPLPSQPQSAAPSVRSSHSRYLDIIRKSRVIKAAAPAPNYAPNSVAAGVAGVAGVAGAAPSVTPGTHFAAAAPHQQAGQLGSHKLTKSPQGRAAAVADTTARPSTSSVASSLASTVQCLLASPELQREGGQGNDKSEAGAAARAATSREPGGRAGGIGSQDHQGPSGGGTVAAPFNPPAFHVYERRTQLEQHLVDEGSAGSPQRMGPSATMKLAGGGGGVRGLEGAAHRGGGTAATAAQLLRKDVASKAPQQQQQRKLHSSWGPKPVASERRCVSAGSAIGVGSRQLSAALSTAEARRRRGEEATAVAAVAAIPPYRMKGGGKKAAAASTSAGGPSSSPWVLHQVGEKCGKCGRCGLGGQPVLKM